MPRTTQPWRKHSKENAAKALEGHQRLHRKMPITCFAPFARRVTTRNDISCGGTNYDALETRDPAAREREQFAQMPAVIAHAMTAPGWAKHLAGADAKAVNSRAALAKLPVLRKADFVALQKETRRSAVSMSRRLQGETPADVTGADLRARRRGGDWWGAARALFAAGFRTGDIVHNSFAYHLTPGGFILESGAHALGCAVIPGGVGNTEQQLEAIAHYRPTGYVGTPDFLKILLDTAEKTGKDRVVAQARSCLGRGAAGLAARRAWPARRCRSAMLCHRRAGGDRLRERGARRHDRERNRHRRDRSARHRRSRAGWRGRRGGRDLVQSATIR